MSAKSFSILMTVWAFVAAPTMCLGGMIGHACDDGDTHRETHRQHPDAAVEPCDGGHVPVPRSHESDCAGDPCSRSVTVGRGQKHADLDIVPHAPPTGVTVACLNEPHDSVELIGAASPTWSALPPSIHLTDHPLLN